MSTVYYYVYNPSTFQYSLLDRGNESNVEFVSVVPHSLQIDGNLFISENAKFTYNQITNRLELYINDQLVVSFSSII